MTPKERDDFFHRLNKLALFYNKPELDQLQRSIWMEVFNNCDPSLCLEAMAKYLHTGKFFPKPAEILTIYKELKSFQSSKERIVNNDEPDIPRDRKLAAAWITFMSVAYDGWGIGKKSYMEFEEAQILVNKHCQTRLSDITLSQRDREDIINSVPDEYKLSEYWG